MKSEACDQGGRLTAQSRAPPGDRDDGAMQFDSASLRGSRTFCISNQPPVLMLPARGLHFP